MTELTVYITRYITCDDDYLMFIECLEHVIKHLKEFKLNIIIFADNETEITNKYDKEIIDTYNCKIMNSEYNINPEYRGLMYHIKHHPTEYMLYIMDNTMLSKDISVDKVKNAVDKYGQLALCYNECLSKFFTIRYKLIEVVMPELIELGSYKDYDKIKNVTNKHISAQGSQLFTSYTAIIKMLDKFPKLLDYIINSKSYTLSDEKDVNNVNDYKRFVRSLCDYVTSQCFFYTYQFPTEIKPLGETEDCVYGLINSNLILLKNYIGRFSNDKRIDIQPAYFSKWLHIKDDPNLQKYFNKFSTLRQQ